MPAFQTRKLQQYIETINKNVAKFMNVLSCKENCDEFDITKIYKIHGLRSILGKEYMSFYKQMIILANINNNIDNFLSFF